jgi:mannose-6-phosphate isomerase-like protein (cupin superfamily)
VATHGCFISLPGEGAAARVSGGPASIRATAAQTNGTLGLWDNTDQPGSTTTLHSHSSAEAFYILDGTYEFCVNGDWYDAPPGSFIFVFPEARHGFRVGPARGRKIAFVVPGGGEALFIGLKAAFDEGRTAPEQLRELALRFDNTPHGPLPERKGT